MFNNVIAISLFKTGWNFSKCFWRNVVIVNCDIHITPLTITEIILQNVESICGNVICQTKFAKAVPCLEIRRNRAKSIMRCANVPKYGMI